MSRSPRSKSTSDAVTIMTQARHRRSAQADAPFHKPSDSLFSITSGFHNFSGMINWAFLLLTIGGTRLLLENINKYGIRVNPMHWVLPIINSFTNFSTQGIYRDPISSYLTLGVSVVFIALYLEKLITEHKIGELICLSLHMTNLFVLLLVPILHPRMSRHYMGPIRSTIVSTAYCIIFLKLVSYIQVNKWCRVASGGNNKMLRTGSLVPLVSRLTKSMESKSTEVDTQIMDITVNVGHLDIVEWPNNLNIRDMAFFIAAPTICYELNFPRTCRIRKSFLIRRIVELLVGVNVSLALFQQWLIPCVVNSLLPFSNMNIGHATERLLKLAIPNHLLWLIWFYLTFHSLLNVIGELLYFADRNFYKDWWNAENISSFWSSWNVLVHKWCVRHLYKPLAKIGFSSNAARICCFVVSAFFHEYMVSVPLRVFKIYAFTGMLSQIPLAALSMYISRRFGSRFGNIIMWFSLIIGQPMAVMMYYHDFVVEHYGTELLKTFGSL